MELMISLAVIAIFMACVVYLFIGLSDLEDMEKENTTKKIIDTVISQPRRM